MPITTLGDVYNQDILASYLTEDPVEKTAFFQSGVIASNQIITELARGASNIINVPFWQRIDASIEPNYSNDQYDDIAVPRSISTDIQKARVAYLNEGFGSADLVAELNKADPLRAIAGMLDTFWMQQAQRRVIATAVGIYNDNVANDASDMVATTSGAIITPGSIIDAEMTMGDMATAGGAIAMHSVVYGQLRKAQLIDFVRDADNNTMIATYGGRRIVVDDGMPVFGAGASRTFLTILFNPGAIGYGEGSPKVREEYDRQPDRANGGGTETLWSRRTMLLHPQGYEFTSATISGNGVESNPMSASWADLALAANWDRKLARKNVPMSFLITGLTEA
ncbi:hypothetical protein [Frigidibacter sp. MR17.24]|uniref:hypothetical protein n=1 Tax=Frigidibacter sp. MR17.24 TaxID=3127345 RepID=UPI003012CE4A